MNRHHLAIHSKQGLSTVDGTTAAHDSQAIGGPTSQNTICARMTEMTTNSEAEKATQELAISVSIGTEALS